MKVSVIRGGGFAGLVTTTKLDSDALPPDDKQTLRARVDGVRSELSKGTPPSARPGPDEQSVRIEIDDEDGPQTITAGETQLSTAQRALVDWVGRSQHREERVVPPGAS